MRWPRSATRSSRAFARERSSRGGRPAAGPRRAAAARPSHLAAAARAQPPRPQPLGRSRSAAAAGPSGTDNPGMIGGMTERSPMGPEREFVCPFVAYDEDRDFRSSVPDHRHRCFAESPAASRALAHQAAYCLSSSFAGCPTFIDWARREAAPPKDEPIRTLREAPVARRDVDRSTRPAGRPTAPQSAPASSGRQRRAEWTAPPPWAPDAGMPARAPEREGDADRWAGPPGPRLPRDEAPDVAPSVEDDGFDAAEGPGLGAAEETGRCRRGPWPRRMVRLGARGPRSLGERVDGRVRRAGGTRRADRSRRRADPGPAGGAGFPRGSRRASRTRRLRRRPARRRGRVSREARGRTSVVRARGRQPGRASSTAGSRTRARTRHGPCARCRLRAGPG